MSYTRGWDQAAPAGTRVAGEIDECIRELRQDLYERLIDKLFVSLPNTTVEADIVIQDLVLGKETNKILLIHPSQFVTVPTSSAQFDYTDTGLIMGVTANAARADLGLPSGVTITRIRWIVTGGDTNIVTLDLRSVLFVTGLNTAVENAQTNNTAAITIKDSGTIAITLSNNKMYHLLVDKLAGTVFTLHGVEITYSCPDGRKTR